MSEKTIYVVASISMFMSGLIFCANLTRLMPTNSVYDAQWWKVGMSLLVAVGASIYGWCNARSLT